MPDQPADPLHYNMKIPPESKENTGNQEHSERDRDHSPAASNRRQQEQAAPEKPAAELPSE